MRHFVAWMGSTDADAAGLDLVAAGMEPRRGSTKPDRGPIALAIHEQPFDQVHILVDRPGLRPQMDQFLEWVRAKNGATPEILVEHVDLLSPVDFRAVYETARDVCDEIRTRDPAAELTFLLSAGTPAMRAIWVILAKSRYGADVIETSERHRVVKVDIPLTMNADLIEAAAREGRRELAALAGDSPGSSDTLDTLTHGSSAMADVRRTLSRIANEPEAVLLTGERGTGKDGLARELHAQSSRHRKELVPLNCAALPADLVESELFGHAKDAFTGATREKMGLIEEADGSTLFLDEIGDLPVGVQAKLLRFLQSGEIRKVGSTESKHVDVRVVAATNRDLRRAMKTDQFRADLYDRFTFVVPVPPVRNRGSGIPILLDSLLVRNNLAEKAPRTLLPEARARLCSFAWPGNVRQMIKVLRNLTMRYDDLEISLEQVDAVLAQEDSTVPGEFEAMPPIAPSRTRVGLPGFSFDEATDRFQLSLIDEAYAQAEGNYARAGRLLGVRQRNRIRRRHKSLKERYSDG